MMASQTWLPVLEGRDAGVTGVPVDHRHPLLDLRIVEFCLSLPTIPWCVDKHILRASARNLLPKSIIGRPKSPLGGDPTPFAIQNYLSEQRKPLALHPALGDYVDLPRLSHLIDEIRSPGYWLALRALILNDWLFKFEENPSGRRK
jgi:asparagine synthase (glutamine-hydrolysing)